MSTIVVTPPAAAARVAVAKPSHSVRPGSLTCTWRVDQPGQQHEVVLQGHRAGRDVLVRADGGDPPAAHRDRGRPVPVRE